VSVRSDELLRFVISPVRSELRQIESRIEDSASRVRQSYATRLRHRTLSTEIEHRNLEQHSLQEQVDALRATLTDLSEEDRALLDQGKSYEDAEVVIDSWLSDLRAVREGATDLQQSVASNLGSATAAPTAPHGDILRAASDEFQAIMQDAHTLLGQIIARAAAPQESLEEGGAGRPMPWARWKADVASFRAAYAAAVQRSSAQKERIEQLQEIEKRLSAHIRETSRLQEELRGLHAADAHYDEQRRAWLQAVGEFDDVLDAQCRTLTENAGGAIRASVRRFTDASGFVERLRDSLGGSNIRRDKLEALGEAITAAKDPGQRWSEIVGDLEKLADFDLERDGVDRRPETPVLSGSGLIGGDLNRIGARLSSDDWLGLSLVVIRSKPAFEYRYREGDYIDFEKASPGQQATALLKSLLNQSGPPLIIDQPEEDLDNPVMPEIVEHLWKAKAHRQIMFASHNANLVVNGDAELVAWCDYRKAGDQSLGKIAGEGAIDVPHVRDAIKRVMEGGEAAFRLRKEKYGF
jgi:chromosome segregation protein